MLSLTLDHWLAWTGLVLAGVASGWLNTIAGAGGLITMPALTLLGLSHFQANATFRVAIVSQSATGVVGLGRVAPQSDGRRIGLLALIVTGALLGAWTATAVSKLALQLALGFAFICALASSVWKPFPSVDAPRPLTWLSRAGLVAAGFYGGMVQTGVGLVLLLALCQGLGYSVTVGNYIKVQATLVFNLVAVAIFAAHGLIIWPAALVLSLGTTLGAILGVRTAARFAGGRFIRVVVAVVATVALAVLAWQIAHGK